MPFPRRSQNSIEANFSACLTVDSVANAIAQIAWEKDRVFDRELALIGARAALRAINDKAIGLEG